MASLRGEGVLLLVCLASTILVAAFLVPVLWQEIGGGDGTLAAPRLATSGTASQTRHIRFGPRLINKNQSLWIQMQLLDTPTCPPLGHVLRDAGDEGPALRPGIHSGHICPPHERRTTARLSHTLSKLNVCALRQIKWGDKKGAPFGAPSSSV